MKLAVVGSRTFTNYDLLDDVLSAVNPDTIISGGARGADRMAARWARQNGKDLVEILPQWEQLGRGAGFARNKQIVDMADEVLAFWDGQSRGTRNTLEHAMDQRKRYSVVYI